jgi:hypothetical protein
MQAEIERLNQINDQLQNEIIQKSQQVSMAQFEGQLDALYNKIEKNLEIKIVEEVAKIKQISADSEKNKKNEKSA